MTEARHSPPLTERERDVVAHIATGLDYRAIGQRLGISWRTVSVHTFHISLKIPNPDNLPPYKLVLRWAIAQRRHAA